MCILTTLCALYECKTCSFDDGAAVGRNQSCHKIHHFLSFDCSEPRDTILATYSHDCVAINDRHNLESVNNMELDCLTVWSTHFSYITLPIRILCCISRLYGS